MTLQLPTPQLHNAQLTSNSQAPDAQVCLLGLEVLGVGRWEFNWALWSWELGVHYDGSMTLVEQISHDITDAMNARDAARLSALRMVKAAFMNSEVSKGRALEEAEAQQVLASLIKQRRDSIEQFKNGGRDDLVQKETAEVAILEKYAPPAASTAELEEAVEAAIRETGAAGPKDMGRVMKAVMAALAGKSADGKAVNEIVRKKLAG